MVKKTYIILIAMVLLISISVYSITRQDPDLVVLYEFDEASNPIKDLKDNGRQLMDLSCTAGVSFQQTSVGYLTDYAINFSGSDYCFNDSSIFNTLWSDTTDTTSTILFGAYFNTLSGNRVMVSSWGDDGSNGGFQIVQADNDFSFITENAGDSKDTASYTSDNKYNQENIFTVALSNSTKILLLNGTDTIGSTAIVNGIYHGSDNGLCIGSKCDSTHTSKLSDGSKIEFLAIFNRSLSLSEIQDIIDNGILGAATATAAPSFAPPTPADNTVNNTNQTLNVTHTGTDIRYYLNVSLEGGDTDMPYIFNETETGSGYKSFLTNFTDGVYTYEFFVQNITNGVFSNPISRTLTIDTTFPTITINGDNSFDSNNIARISQYLNYLFLNISFSDTTNLFGVLINITKDGVSFFNYTNISFGTGIGNKTFNFTRNISTGSWPPGVFNVSVTASDSHTSATINDYDISSFLGKITFKTNEGNEISISAGGSSLSTTNTKRKDRYEFGFNYLLSSTNRKFTLTSKSKIYYLPNSKYNGHFVILGEKLNGNWVDFEGVGGDYTVKKISDFKYEIDFINLPNDNKISFKSLGGVNIVTEEFKWYKGNYTTIAPKTSSFGNTETFTLNISRNSTFAVPNATFIYDGVTFSTTTTDVNPNYIIFSRDLSIPSPTLVSNVINFTWAVNINQSDDSVYFFNITNSVNVSLSLIDNCTDYNNTILVINGKDEETDRDVNLTLNILFAPSTESNSGNNSYELSGSTNYTFCTDSDSNFTLDSIMEYGDETYTDRKYYLNDFAIDTSQIQRVTLYHLNNSKASEIVFTVFDTTTGDRVPNAFIKILRFYPGENVFRIVEIAKTDVVGQSLGKMVLADVFYKFIIEAPAGTVKLNTGVLRILSLTRNFGISFTTDILDTWDKIHGVSTLVTCTKGTQTCRITWSDESNIIQDATLEVWRTSGFQDVLLFSQTTTAAAGTISYTITEDTLGKVYTAKGFIESNTGTSTYGSGIASLIYPDNPFFTDQNQRIASIFPLFLFGVVMIFVLIDFGVIGVVIGALLVLVTGSITSILPLSQFFLISFMLMAAISIYKLSK